MSLPKISIVPAPGGMSPTIVFSSTDLPAPEAPTTAEHFARMDIEIDVALQARARRRAWPRP